MEKCMVCKKDAKIFVAALKGVEVPNDNLPGGKYAKVVCKGCYDELGIEETKRVLDD